MGMIYRLFWGEQWYHSPTCWKLGRCCIDFAAPPGSGYPIYPTGEVWCRKTHLRCILPSPPSNMRLSWNAKSRTKITSKKALIWEGWQGRYIFLLEEDFQPKRGEKAQGQCQPKVDISGYFWGPCHLPNTSHQLKAHLVVFPYRRVLLAMRMNVHRRSPNCSNKSPQVRPHNKLSVKQRSTASLSAASIHFGHGASLFLQTTQRVSFGSQSKHFLIKEILWCSDSPQPFLTIPR